MDKPVYTTSFARASLKRKRSIARKSMLGLKSNDGVLENIEDDDIDAEGSDDLEYLQDLVQPELPEPTHPQLLYDNPTSKKMHDMDSPVPPLHHPPAPGSPRVEPFSVASTKRRLGVSFADPTSTDHGPLAFTGDVNIGLIPQTTWTARSRSSSLSELSDLFESDNNSKQPETLFNAPEGFSWGYSEDRRLLKTIVETSLSSPIPWEVVWRLAKGHRITLQMEAVKKRWDALQRSLLGTTDAPLALRPLVANKIFDNDVASAVMSSSLAPISWDVIEMRFKEQTTQGKHGISIPDLQERYCLWKDDKEYLGSLMRQEGLSIKAEEIAHHDNFSNPIVKHHVTSKRPRKGLARAANSGDGGEGRLEMDVKPIITNPKRQWGPAEHDMLVESVIRNSTVDWSQVYSDISSTGGSRTMTAIKRRWIDIRSQVRYR